MISISVFLSITKLVGDKVGTETQSGMLLLLPFRYSQSVLVQLGLVHQPFFSMRIPKTGKYTKGIAKSGTWKLRISRGFSANLVLAAWFVFGGFLQHILLCNFLAILLKEINLI